MVTKLGICLLLCAIGAKAKVSYENYKVYDVLPKSESQVQVLLDLQKQGYEFWTDEVMRDKNVSLLIAPNQDAEFVEYSKKVGMNTFVRIPNVQRLIDAQLEQAAFTEERNSNIGNFSWTKYHNLEEIHAWLYELQELYPNIVTTVNAGQSNEGRAILGVIIDFKAGQRGDNPLAGMIEGGIHSREWISPATVTWIIKEFLTSNEADVRFMAETFVWHIFPVINPDGYVYTFSENRMWRKNRNPANSTSCVLVNDDLSNGIDLNRNFNFLWMTVGASQNPCAETFAGPTAASEPETRAISNYVLQLKQDYNLLYYFAFHSYSQMILIPYSHASGQGVLEVANYGDLYEIAIRGATKLTARHGTPYLVGTSADILYEVSGASVDWAKGVADIPIAFLFELRDVGTHGFLLPADQIIPNSEEIMDCLLEMNMVTQQLRYYHSGSSSLMVSLITMCISSVLLFFR